MGLGYLRGKPVVVGSSQIHNSRTSVTLFSTAIKAGLTIDIHTSLFMFVYLFSHVLLYLLFKQYNVS